MWTQAARALRAGAHSTLHGVVFAILCLGSAVYRRRGAALRPGHEIVSASRSRRIDPTPMHPALIGARAIPAHLVAARCCYTHLAGRLGVALADALVKCRYVTIGGDCAALTERGTQWATDM